MEALRPLPKNCRYGLWSGHESRFIAGNVTRDANIAASNYAICPPSAINIWTRLPIPGFDSDVLFRRFRCLTLLQRRQRRFHIMAARAGYATALNVDGVERHRKKWNAVAKSWYLLSEWLATWCCSVVITDAQKIREYYWERYGKDSTFIAYGAETNKVSGTDHVAPAWAGTGPLRPLREPHGAGKQRFVGA